MSTQETFVPWTTPHERIRVLIRTATAVLGCGVIAIGALWVASRGPYFADRPFEASAWAAANPITDDTRWRMRHDLVNKHLRPGITVSEVEILLGAGEGDSATLTYRLRNRGYIDPEFDRLIVGFDDAGTLSSVRIESAREGD